MAKIRDDLIPTPPEIAGSLAPAAPGAGDAGLTTDQQRFDGQWLPDADPLSIGKDNFAVLQNLRPLANGELETVPGCTSLDSAALAVPFDYTDAAETDVVADRIVLSAGKVTVTALDCDEAVNAVWELGDDGVGNNGHFHALLDFTCTSTGARGCYVWGMSADGAHLSAGGDQLSLLHVHDGGTEKLILKTRESGSETTWEMDITGDHGGHVYLRIFKYTDPMVYVLAYSDAAHGNNIGQAFVFPASPDRIYRYIHAMCSHNTGASGCDWTGTVENFRLHAKVRSACQLRSAANAASTLLAQGETLGARRYVFENRTAINATGDFEAAPLYTEQAGAGLGRFAEAPQDHVLFCDGVESCLYGGRAVRPAAFFLVEQVRAAFSDVTLTDGGAGADTIVSAAGDFRAAGVRAGAEVDLTETASNNIRVTVDEISADGTTLTLPTGSLNAGEAIGTVTVTAASDAEALNPRDFTREVSNRLTTTGNTVPLGGGTDAARKLLVHCDGDHQSAALTDASGAGHAITATNVTLDADFAKFGNASARFNGTSAKFTAADHADWYMGTGRAMVEMQVALSDKDQVHGLFSQYTDASNYVQLYWQKILLWQHLIFEIKTGGTTICHLAALWRPISKRFYHVAVIRGWGDDDDRIALTVNGRAIGQTTVTAGGKAWGDYSGALTFGHAQPKGAWLKGWLDEVSVSKGTARKTADFAKPTAPYGSGPTRGIVFATRPIQGVNVTMAEVNRTASDLTFKTWTGRNFTELAITDGTVSGSAALGRDGTVSWDDTTGLAVPMFFEGVYLYPYLFDLSAGDGEIAQITLNAAMQPVGDIWDGVLRQPLTVQFWDNAAGYYKDYTQEVYEPSDEEYPIGCVVNAMTADDHLVMAFEERAAAFMFGILGGLGNNHDATLALERWNGSEWVAEDLVRDGTLLDDKTRTFARTGYVQRLVPLEGEEKRRTEFNVTGYFYRFTVSATLDDLTPNQVTLDVIAAIPAPQPVRAFAFPSSYKSRPLLCNHTAGNEPTRVDFGMTDTVNVFNGAESSRDGLQSLYFGQQGALLAGGELYNRYGSTLYTVWLGLLDRGVYLLEGSGPEDFRIFPISTSVGICAPQSLIFAEVGFEMAADVRRNIAAWLSWSGPVVFDGAVLARLEGINTFFDVASDLCVNWDAIERAWSVFDPAHSEWWIGLPTGTATTVNTWVAYSFPRRRWYEVAPAAPCYPDAVCRVIDANGQPHVYGLVAGATRTLLRLGHGADWNGTAIAWKVTTGDFFPAGSVWLETLIRDLMMIATRVATAGTCLRVLHYADTSDEPVSYPHAQQFYVSFTAPSTIATTGESFAAHGFAAGQNFDCDSITDELTIASIAADGKTITTVEDTVPDRGAGSYFTFEKTADLKLDLSGGSTRLVRAVRPVRLRAWAHRLEFSGQVSTAAKELRLIGWGMRYRIEREALTHD